MTGKYISNNFSLQSCQATFKKGGDKPEEKREEQKHDFAAPHPPPTLPYPHCPRKF